MTMFATVDDLRLLTQTPTLDEATGEQALTLATALVQSEAAQRFVPGESTVVLHAPSGTWLELPERPIVAVSTVRATVLGQPALTQPALLPGVHYLIVGGMLYTAYGGWSRYGTVSVTYTHGFAVIPDDLRTITLTIAARLVLNPQNVRSETIGSYTYTLSGDTSGLSMYEKAVARRYRVATHSMVGR
jgi:hypothetical protein